MAHTDAHRKIANWSTHDALSHFRKHPGIKTAARIRQQSMRAAERDACRIAARTGETPDLVTRHRHNAEWDVM